MKYYLSLGSNINPELNLDLAIASLSKILAETKCSSIYKTQAEGFDGDDFLNLIFCGTSSLSFESLNKKLKDITTEISKLNIKEQRQIAIIILASVLRSEDSGMNLLWSNIIKDIKISKGEIIQSSSDHDSGEQLSSFGGAIALLRWKLD